MSNAFPVKTTIKRPEKRVQYKRLFQWAKEYGRSGPDQKAVAACMSEENADYIRMLRIELQAVAKGHYDDRQFEQILGRARKQRHKSYMAWARLMLQLMAGYKGY